MAAPTTLPLPRPWRPLAALRRSLPALLVLLCGAGAVAPLQDAARQLISAARAFLDAAEALVDDPEAVAHMVEVVSETARDAARDAARVAAAVGRRAARAASSAGDGSDGDIGHDGQGLLAQLGCDFFQPSLIAVSQHDFHSPGNRLFGQTRANTACSPSDDSNFHDFLIALNTVLLKH